jgi:hypothetical protein
MNKNNPQVEVSNHDKRLGEKSKITRVKRLKSNQVRYDTKSCRRYAAREDIALIFYKRKQG